MKNKFILIGTSAFALSLAAAAPSQALQLISPDCSTASVGQVSCSGAYAGNDANQTDLANNGSLGTIDQLAMDFGSLTGDGDWTYSDDDKTDAGVGGRFLSNVTASDKGTINFASTLTGFFAVAFKAGNQFSFYLFDGGTTGLDNISFDTFGTNLNGRGRAGKSLSHATLYRFSGAETIVPPDTTPVPTPAAILPAIAGMIGAATKRKKSIDILGADEQNA